MPMACCLKWRGGILNSSCFAMVTVMWHYFWTVPHFLDVCNITLLVDLHVCGQRNSSIFPARPSKHVDEHRNSTPPLCLCHFVEVLEDDGHSKQVEVNLYESALDFYHVVMDTNSTAPLPTEPSFQTSLPKVSGFSDLSPIFFSLIFAVIVLRVFSFIFRDARWLLVSCECC